MPLSGFGGITRVPDRSNAETPTVRINNLNPELMSFSIFLVITIRIMDGYFKRDATGIFWHQANFYRLGFSSIDLGRFYSFYLEFFGECKTDIKSVGISGI